MERLDPTHARPREAEQPAEQPADRPVAAPIALSVDTVQALAAAPSATAIAQAGQQAGWSGTPDLTHAPPAVAELLDYHHRPAATGSGGTLGVGLAALGLGLGFAIAENAGEPLIAAVAAFICAGIALFSLAGRSAAAEIPPVPPHLQRAVRTVLPGLRHPRAVRAALHPCLVPHAGTVLDHTHAAEALLQGWRTELERQAPPLADARDEMAAAVSLLDELAALPPGAAPSPSAGSEAGLLQALARQQDEAQALAEVLHAALAHVHAIRAGAPTSTDPQSLQELLVRCDAWHSGNARLLRQVGALSKA